MGEVYRARDTRLGRDVAIKVLPADFARDADRLRRFELEARAVAALSHPNIVALFDIGTHDGAPYLVSELLEGRTLREVSSGGPMPVRQAAEMAVQIARGLAAAHEKGIVHRDLKPANVFVTKTGHVKILDFGLAKLARPEADEFGSAVTEAPSTETGAVMGTVGYMSPEQVRGQRVDHRTDIFAFGCVLHEMLAGRPPFRRETAAETMAAILREEPAELTGPGLAVPAALERVVRRCLEKEAGQRFSSAHDLALAIEALSAPSTTGTVPAMAPTTAPREPILRSALTAAILVALVVGAGGLAWYVRGRMADASSTPLTFQRLTYRRGWVSAARFAPDEHTVFYSAEWNGEPTDVFSRRLESPEAQSLGYRGADLLAISPTSELALAQDTGQPRADLAFVGTLARVPSGAGTPRTVDSNIVFADWSADGKELVVARDTSHGNRLEWPPGTPVYSSEGLINSPRVSRSGDRVAFFEFDPLNFSASVVVVDRLGKRTALTGKFQAGIPGGLAWSPKGDEVWFGAASSGLSQEIRAVALNGRQRLLYRTVLSTRILDVSKDGRVLVALDRHGGRNFFRAVADATERELSWLDFSIVTGLSDDGRRALISEQGDSVGSVDVWGELYIRDTSGQLPQKLGPGYGFGFSSKDRVVAAMGFSPPGIVLYPIPSGPPETIALKDFVVSYVSGLLAPGYQDVVVTGTESRRPPRIWLVSRDGKRRRAITPDGVSAVQPVALTPDGSFVLGQPGSQLDGKILAYPTATAGGEPQPLPGLRDGEEVAGWGADGHSFFAYRPRELPLKIYRVDYRTGARTPLGDIMPADNAGRLFRNWVIVTPDGKAYAYSVVRWQSELHLIEGLK
jgi:hypothetical protein